MTDDRTDDRAETAAAEPAKDGGDRPLAGRLALITGASSGIGASTAVELARAGADVALVGRRENLLAQVRRRVLDEQVAGHAVPMDLSVPDAPSRLVERVREAAGRDVDILVNNAAVARSGPMHQVAPRHWDLALRMNLTVPFQLANALLPAMRERGHGWVVNIGSVGGLRPLPGAGPYSVSKHALHYLTELLDLENRPAGVRALCLCPGWVRTEMALEPEQVGVDEELLVSADEFAQVVRWAVTLPARVSVGPVIPVYPTSDRAALDTVWQRLLGGARQPWEAPLESREPLENGTAGRNAPSPAG
ncbi:SDR family oxidoreductase [Streptomyces sp. TRM 70361]|uniref:SDR family NAD(P)-dependent oxidoreductase n=1 Tax=Streptomyces sp. TRM 70361 TaxID=3116553 RepID=UPI002E7BD7FA|nr:SDR family oxidoreductase [Streptomyces sp. TRM 70361]MEE1942784.1 SDR family oxidoreductase [Streptomyces sp. TRM 70361]